MTELTTAAGRTLREYLRVDWVRDFDADILAIEREAAGEALGLLAHLVLKPLPESVVDHTSCECATHNAARTLLRRLAAHREQDEEAGGVT